MKIFLLTFMFLISGSLEAKVKLNVNFTNPYIFLPLKGASATAGYVEIKNDGDKEVTLVLKSVEGFKAVETHETIEKNSQMIMQKVENFKIAAFTSLDLKPGASHIMLFEPNRTFKEGDKVQAIFTANGQEIKLPFKMVSRNKDESVHTDH